jgi:two-component system OmpR family response regulator
MGDGRKSLGTLRPREQVTVLLVDEDEIWRTQAAAALFRHGYDAMSVSEYWRVVGMLDEASPDLVVLCAHSPANDARFSILLAQWRPLPHLVLLCSADRLGERAASLAAGANECLRKPNDPQEICDLVDRLVPFLPPRGGQGGAAEIEGWRLNLHNGRLIAPHGAAADLVGGDFRLLRAFLDHRGRVLNRAQLHRLCGMADEIGERVVDRRISHLRRTLKLLDPRPEFIRTVREEGYLFVGRIACNRVRG